MLRRRLDLMPQVCACFLDQRSKSIVTFLCHCVRDLVLTRAFKRRNHIHHQRRRRQDNIVFFEELTFKQFQYYLRTGIAIHCRKCFVLTRE